MTAAVETMAYAGAVPWHGLGVPVTADLTPKQMLKAAALDWTVSKRELYFMTKDGKQSRAGSEWGLVRDSDESLLTTCGATWKPVQNEAAMEFFRKFVAAGHMTMETAGSLWDGRYIWALARVGKDFTLGKTDTVRSYLLLMSPHVHGKAMVFQFTPIRVVCWNTLTAALGSSLKGHGSAFRMIHSTDFNDGTKALAEKALGLAIAQTEEFKDVATILSKKKAKPADVEQYFCEVLQYDPKKAKAKVDDKDQRVPIMLPKFRAALEHAPGQQLNTAAGTWWGALNAVTHVIDHETGRDRSTALRNAWVGNHANTKRDALTLAIKMAA